MSHFTVLVATKSERDVGSALQPYHEFECTGIDDQYVVDIDKTEEVRKEFSKSTTRMLKDSFGHLHEPYEDRFYREPTPEEFEQHGPFMGTGASGDLSYTSKDWEDGKGYRAKIRFIPSGYEEIQVQSSTMKTFAQWASGWIGAPIIDTKGKIVSDEEDRSTKYGFIAVDDSGEVLRVVDRTNPNKKWDWYVIGGRWSGSLLKKDGVRVDQARKSDVDFEGIRQEERLRAATDYDAAAAIINGDQFTPWKTFYDKFPKEIQKARDLYHAQPAIKRLGEDERFKWTQSVDKFLLPRTDYIEKTAAMASVCLAVLHDGKWHERGEMGWWGAIHDDKEDAWPSEYDRLIAAIPDDYILTVVDCHI